MNNEAKIVDIAVRTLDAYRVLAIKLTKSSEWKQTAESALLAANDLSRELASVTDLVDGDLDA